MASIDPFADHPIVVAEDLFSHARDFELLVASFYKRCGCEVQDIGGTGERGADLIVIAGDKRIAVQVKCSTREVGVGAVRQTKRGMLQYQADEGVLICIGNFSWQGQELAKLEAIKLINGDTLFKKLNDKEKLEFRRIEDLAIQRRTQIAATRVPRRR